jgi:nitrate/nitrite transport system permease protein
MVAAVFHSPFSVPPDATDKAKATSKLVAYSAYSEADKDSNASKIGAESSAASAQATKIGYDWRGLWLKVVPPILGLALLVGIWAMVSVTSTNNFPSPWATAQQAVQVFSDPFYQKGPNDQGIGWNIWSSLKRVAVGFGLALYVFKPHVQPPHQPAAPRVATGVVTDWPAGI